MVGTGVFTSLGYQLVDIDSAPVILLLWVLGGVLALCGALCYAELGAALPRSGGEYNYLSRIYGPGIGFVSGWISLTVGFAAPTALAAMTAGRYFEAIAPSVSDTLTAVVLVIVVTLFHIRTREGSAIFQQTVTTIKIVLIVAMIVGVLTLMPGVQDLRWTPNDHDMTLLGTGGFAVALIFVNYAYTGWNAATYIAGEVQQPDQTLPKILLIGTVVVTALYVTLHWVFLISTPMSAMVGKIEIGFVVAEHVFGSTGGKVVGLVLALLLVSTVSAMILAGPRALQMMGQDLPRLKFLAKENDQGIPIVAVLALSGVTLLFVLTSTFDAVLVFSGAVLALNTLFAVVGVVILRKREPDLVRPFRLPWYPIPVVIYATITIWTLTYLVGERPTELAFAFAVISSGWLFYWFSRARVDD